MLWFQRYELLESRTRGNSVKLKTTFNLSRELLAPPEPPSPRRVNFSLLLGFHLAAVFVTRGTIYAGSIRVPHLLLTCSRSLLPKGSSPPSFRIQYTLHVIALGFLCELRIQSNLTPMYWRPPEQSLRKLPSPSPPPPPHCPRFPRCVKTLPFTWTRSYNRLDLEADIFIPGRSFSGQEMFSALLPLLKGAKFQN